MGYTFRIGEAFISYEEDSIDIDVQYVKVPESPSFGDPTDGTNERWPSYTDWANSMEALGLDQLFDPNCQIVWNGKPLRSLKPSHPGVAPITKRHIDYVKLKLKEYKNRFPDHIAQYPPLKSDAVPVLLGFYANDAYVNDPKYDSNLVRGEWMLWWMEWAIQNCKYPTFYNS